MSTEEEVITPEVRIFRYTDTDDDVAGSTFTDFIDVGGNVNITKSGVTIIHNEVKVRPTDNPNLAQEGASKPDTGNTGLRVIIDFYLFLNEPTDKAKARLLLWALQKKDIKNKFKGRFGLLCPTHPHLEITPNSNYGYKFVEYFIDENGEWENQLKGQITLDLVGSNLTDFITTLNSILSAQST